MYSWIQRQSICLVLAVTFSMPGWICAQTIPVQRLELQVAIIEATDNDLWLQSNKQSQAAVQAQAISVGSLPDPNISVAFANLPTDSFEFNQEPMTQLKLEVRQMFPRGNSRELKRQEKEILSTQFPLQRDDRRARVTRAVTLLWLDGFKAQNTIALIEQNRALFEQLVDVAQAGYASTARRTRQQDIVRAQLELTLLEDRLTKLKMQHDTATQQLGEWLPLEYLQKKFPADLPDLNVVSVQELTGNELTNALLKHPSILALEKQISMAGTNVELAKQNYKPEWGVMASYGYRDDAPNNIERSDFLSIGVSFDLPLFTGNRQDKQVSAATMNAEAQKTKKLLLLKEMLAEVSTLRVKLFRNNERLGIYEQQLLPQIHEQAEAALTAYTNDDGDFSEVMRARIAELNANIEFLNIRIDRQKILAHLQYFQSDKQMTKTL